MSANGAEATGGWTEHAIAPVANPIFFESPLIQSEVHPIFMEHRMNHDFLGADVNVQVYAVQLRYAVNDRLAIIATKDGYIRIDQKGADGQNGWGNLAAGLKYALIQDDSHSFVLTPGFTVELPTGSKHVFQGTGDGIFNVFVSAMKGWGDFHATANAGVRVPVDSDANTTSVYYGAMLDYWVCRWFTPFVAVNAFTTVSNGKGLPLTTEGFDLVNFGSSHASGETQAAVGVGFRSHLYSSVDLGFAYEYGVSSRADIFKDRFTVDLIWRF
jgi:hypothetical protein